MYTRQEFSTMLKVLFRAALFDIFACKSIKKKKRAVYKIDQSPGRHRQEQNKTSVAGIIVLDLTTERVRENTGIS